MTKNILIINPFGIGDVLFSTPLVSAIKETYSNSYIAYICNLKTKDILTTNPAINEVFVFERGEYRNLWKESKISAVKKFFGFWGDIKKRKFDIVFDLSLGKEYALLCWWIGIKDRRGFNYIPIVFQVSFIFNCFRFVCHASLRWHDSIQSSNASNFSANCTRNLSMRLLTSFIFFVFFFAASKS